MAKVRVSRQTVRLVEARAAGRCEIDGLPLANGRHLHHRQPRGMGSSTEAPHDVDNLLLLHPNCHLTRVERQRDEAYRHGWLVRHGTDPATVPVLTYQGWVWLRADGSVTLCSESESGLLRILGADGQGA